MSKPDWVHLLVSSDGEAALSASEVAALCRFGIIASAEAGTRVYHFRPGLSWEHARAALGVLRSADED